MEARAREMAAKLSEKLPYPLIYKVTAKTNREITDIVKEANYDDGCAGIISDTPINTGEELKELLKSRNYTLHCAGPRAEVEGMSDRPAKI